MVCPVNTPTSGWANRIAWTVIPDYSKFMCVSLCIINIPGRLTTGQLLCPRSYTRRSAGNCEESDSLFRACFVFLKASSIQSNAITHFRAAALATGCQLKVVHYGAVFDLRQNTALGQSPSCGSIQTSSQQYAILRRRSCQYNTQQVWQY